MRPIEKLTLKDMIEKVDLYVGLTSGLREMPLPQYIKIGRKELHIPKTYEELSANICYGQRLFLTQEEKNDFGLIIRMIDGYYYPIYSGKTWDDDEALYFGGTVLSCKAIDIYPVAIHLIGLMSELVENENTLLHREPSKLEKAAGIEKLSVYSDLTAVDFLRQVLNKSFIEVMLTPYRECLVRFMLQKETVNFQERYFELSKEESTPKSKYR